MILYARVKVYPSRRENSLLLIVALALITEVADMSLLIGKMVGLITGVRVNLQEHIKEITVITVQVRRDPVHLGITNTHPLIKGMPHLVGIHRVVTVLLALINLEVHP